MNSVDHSYVDRMDHMFKHISNTITNTNNNPNNTNNTEEYENIEYVEYENNDGGVGFVEYDEFNMDELIQLKYQIEEQTLLQQIEEQQLNQQQHQPQTQIIMDNNKGVVVSIDMSVINQDDAIAIDADGNAAVDTTTDADNAADTTTDAEADADNGKYNNKQPSNLVVAQVKTKSDTIVKSKSDKVKSVTVKRSNEKISGGSSNSTSTYSLKEKKSKLSSDIAFDQVKLLNNTTYDYKSMSDEEVLKKLTQNQKELLEKYIITMTTPSSKRIYSDNFISVFVIKKKIYRTLNELKDNAKRQKSSTVESLLDNYVTQVEHIVNELVTDDVIFDDINDVILFNNLLKMVYHMLDKINKQTLNKKQCLEVYNKSDITNQRKKNDEELVTKIKAGIKNFIEMKYDLYINQFDPIKTEQSKKNLVNHIFKKFDDIYIYDSHSYISAQNHVQICDGIYKYLFYYQRTRLNNFFNSYNELNITWNDEAKKILQALIYHSIKIVVKSTSRSLIEMVDIKDSNKKEDNKKNGNKYDRKYVFNNEVHTVFMPVIETLHREKMHFMDDRLHKFFKLFTIRIDVLKYICQIVLINSLPEEPNFINIIKSHQFNRRFTESLTEWINLVLYNFTVHLFHDSLQKEYNKKNDTGSIPISFDQKHPLSLRNILMDTKKNKNLEITGSLCTEALHSMSWIGDVDIMSDIVSDLHDFL